jgi:hypothetical protein
MDVNKLDNNNAGRAPLIELDNRTIALIILGAMAILGFVGIFVVLPMLAQFGLAAEAFALLTDGIGEYFGQPRVIWLGCLVFIMICAGCCLIVIVLGGATLTCSSSTPSQLCRLIMR